MTARKPFAPVNTIDARKVDYDEARTNVLRFYAALIDRNVYPSKAQLFYAARQAGCRYSDRLLRKIMLECQSDGSFTAVGRVDLEDRWSEREEEFGEKSRRRIERRTAITLARRLGLTRPPRAWRTWYAGEARRKLAELQQSPTA